MSEKYVMKANDLLPSFEVQLLDGTTPIDLTSAVSVLFLMRSRKGVKATGPMIVADQTIPANVGVVRYDWTDGDTATSGSYNAEVQVTWPPNRSQTFPANQYILVEIQKDLGPIPAAFTTLTLGGGGELSGAGENVEGMPA